MTKLSLKNLDALNEMDDNRIHQIRPVIPPQILMEDLPLSNEAVNTVKKARFEAEQIIKMNDDRLLVIVGPCSIHDINAAKEYAQLLKDFIPTVQSDLCIIMRVYFEKPRTTVGWKGLINDPNMDESFAINKGLRTARQLLLDLNNMGIPAAVEFLDTISPQYLADLVSWGAIGARTTESQVHRELASGLSAPVGFKNGTDGNVTVAVDAIRSASSGHNFLSVTKQGLSAIVETLGNDSCHVILRGGNSGPNYDSTNVRECGEKLLKAGLKPGIMIDCSHGNSSKQHKRQIVVAQDIVNQLSVGSTPALVSSGEYIAGVMIESHLVEGRQNLTDDPSKLVYGQSITDACINWEDTKDVLENLARGVRARRAARQ
ncbi:phospho-2-dehydro-3-deoxyheptonate aldolase [Globomyces pollinis-pini]|nr:phospho-2-dehydro-3-deoxyheptonate aldolase [Globomyces pollinis-pini]